MNTAYMFLEYGRKYNICFSDFSHVEDREEEDARYLLSLYFLTMTALEI